MDYSDGVYVGEYDVDFIYAKVEISGATNSSIVIKKEVENALKSRKLTTF